MLNFAHRHNDVGIYRPRDPQTSGYYRCVQDHFEQLEMQWQDRYAQRYGFWRPFVTDVIYRYLECGDLHVGFARVRCQDSGHEYLLALVESAVSSAAYRRNWARLIEKIYEIAPLLCPMCLGSLKPKLLTMTHIHNSRPLIIGPNKGLLGIFNGTI